MPEKDRSVVRVTKRLDPGANWQIEPELTPEELQIVGLITVQWAHLEHCLYVRTHQLTETVKLETPEDAKSLSFANRLRAFRDLAKALEKEEGAVVEKLADRIANAEDQRHKITHGMWDWEHTNPEILAAYSFREPYEYEHPFDLEELKRLADRIGELLFDLSFPNGLADVNPAPYPGRFPGTPIPFKVEAVEGSGDES